MCNDEQPELRTAERAVQGARGEPVKRLHHLSAHVKGREKHASQAQAPALRANWSLRPRPRGRGVSTHLRAGCSIRGGSVGNCQCGVGIAKAVLRCEVDWKASRAEIFIAISAVPPISPLTNARAGTLCSIAAVVVFVIAKEAHAATAAALGALAYTLLTGAEVPTVRSCIAALLI